MTESEQLEQLIQAAQQMADDDRVWHRLAGCSACAFSPSCGRGLRCSRATGRTLQRQGRASSATSAAPCDVAWSRQEPPENISFAPSCREGNAGIVGISYRYFEHVCDMCEYKCTDVCLKERETSKRASNTTLANTSIVIASDKLQNPPNQSISIQRQHWGPHWGHDRSMV